MNKWIDIYIYIIKSLVSPGLDWGLGSIPGEATCFEPLSVTVNPLFFRFPRARTDVTGLGNRACECASRLTRIATGSCALPRQRATACSVCSNRQSAPSEWSPPCICNMNTDELCPRRGFFSSYTCHFQNILTSRDLCAAFGDPGKGWLPYRSECGYYILRMSPPRKHIRIITYLVFK